MAKKLSMEDTITDIVEMVKSAGETRAEHKQISDEVKQLILTKKEVLEDIKKARKKKDKALVKMRDEEEWAKKEIIGARKSVGHERRLAEDKKKLVFDEMTADIKEERERNICLVRENRELDEVIKGKREKLQKLKEGIDC